MQSNHSGTVKDDDKVWKGKIEIPNLSEENDAHEVNVSQWNGNNINDNDSISVRVFKWWHLIW